MWSFADLLEKLVNGFPLVGLSTFEQVEDEAQWPQGQPQFAWSVPNKAVALCSRLLPASSLSLLFQRTEPGGPLGFSNHSYGRVGANPG